MNDKSTRRIHSLIENSNRCHWEIERFIYAMELLCNEDKRYICTNKDCAFHIIPTPPYNGDIRCKLNMLRAVIGEHADFITITGIDNDIK